jgi:hypothetical protein
MASAVWRWSLSIFASAGLLLAIGVALGLSGGDEAPEPDAPARVDATGVTDVSGPQPEVPRPQTPPRAPVEAERIDPDERELMAIERIAADNAADLETLGARLEALARKPGEIGIRATVLLSRITKKREDRAQQYLARFLDRASAAEAEGRFGEALAAIEEFPAETYAGTAAAVRAKLEADALKGRAARGYAEAAYRAELFAAKGDFGAARATYRAVRKTMGIAIWVDRADQALRDLGRREEEAAAAERTRRAAAAARALRDEFERGIASIARSCRSFKYSEAEKTLGDLMAKPLNAADRKRLSDYGEVVRREAAHFRLVALRIRTGEREALLGWENSPHYVRIIEVTEDGLEMRGLGTSGSLQTRRRWARIGMRQTFKLMRDICSNVRDLNERLALAVFAHHHGLPTERENELRVAGDLARTSQERELVERIRRILKTIDVER